MRARVLYLSAVLALSIVALPCSALAAKDYANIARDIVPSGDFGTIPTPATLGAIERQVVPSVVRMSGNTPLTASLCVMPRSGVQNAKQS